MNAVILKGKINLSARPRARTSRMVPVRIINGHLSNLWPTYQTKSVQLQVDHWLRTTDWVRFSDPEVSLHLSLLEDAFCASDCRSGFRRVSRTRPHIHSTWFTLWGQIVNDNYFCTRNLSQVLYSPEYQVGIVRRVIRLGIESVDRAHQRLVQQGVITD